MQWRLVPSDYSGRIRGGIFFKTNLFKWKFQNLINFLICTWICIKLLHCLIHIWQKRKCLQQGCAALKGPGHKWVCKGWGEGSFAPSNCSAPPASVSGKKNGGGQQQYDETRGFARQAREKVGWSLDTFVLRICWALGNPGLLVSSTWLSIRCLEEKYVALMTDLLTRKVSTGSLCLWWGMWLKAKHREDKCSIQHFIYIDQYH